MSGYGLVKAVRGLKQGTSTVVICVLRKTSEGRTLDVQCPALCLSLSRELTKDELNRWTDKG